MDYANIIATIMKKYNLGKIEKCNILFKGFNRTIIVVNDKYVIKLCLKVQKENNIRNEVDFYLKNKSENHPKLINYNFDKTIIPYYYSIEEYIAGKNLFEIWPSINMEKREEILLKLINILKSIHLNVGNNEKIRADFLDLFNKRIDELEMFGVLPKEKILYLQELSKILPKYIKETKTGIIHGDIHFNNLIYNEDDGNLRVIDFECVEESIVDKEFDSIARMVNNPSSYFRDEDNVFFDKSDFDMIIPFMKENYSEICGADGFNERIIIYECLNALKWIKIYPDHEPYHEALFQKSKLLLK